MVRRIGFVFAACLTTWSASAAAGEPQPSVPEGADAAGAATEASCRYVRAVAESTSALLFAPTLFVSGGMITGSDASTGASATPAQPRLTAGLSYSVAGIVRGSATKRLAEAECERLALFNELLAYSFAYGGGNLPAALQGKMKVFEEARPKVAEIVARARTSFADSKTTQEDLNAVLARADAIDAAAADTQGRLRTGAGAMKAPSLPLRVLLERRDEKERASERQLAALRQSQAWDVSVRGGYDQVFGVRQPVPVFGMLTVSFNPGLFWQRPADDRAIAARADAARTGLEAASERATDMARQLAELATAERARLVQLDPLVAELEARQAQIAALEGDRARAAADGLWLALVPLRAERTFLRLHVDALARLVADAPAGTVRP